MELGNRFLARHAEKENLNQYWYSPATIQVIVQELLRACSSAAFLSTPSLYFSLPKTSDLRAKSALLDVDQQWSKEPNFVQYDFSKPENIPSNILNSFDCVVIDPPFITEEVWRHASANNAAATSADITVEAAGKIVLSTIPENAPFLKQLLGVEPQPFRPCIPHLVYQYCIFTNYSSEGFSQANPEVQIDDDV